MGECRWNGWKAHSEPTEVGCRGFVGHSLHCVIGLLGICGLHTVKHILNEAFSTTPWSTSWKLLVEEGVGWPTVVPGHKLGPGHRRQDHLGEGVWCKTRNIPWPQVHHLRCVQFVKVYLSTYHCLSEISALNGYVTLTNYLNMILWPHGAWFFIIRRKVEPMIAKVDSIVVIVSWSLVHYGITVYVSNTGCLLYCRGLVRSGSPCQRNCLEICSGRTVVTRIVFWTSVLSCYCYLVSLLHLLESEGNVMCGFEL